jgi:SPP1 family predicted phage head-tail adaptor
MSLPKRASDGFKYLPSSAFNTYVTFLNPNAGQAGDGTPNPATVVASGIHAAISPWRSKETDKEQARVATSSYKIVVRYPKTYSVDTGMQLQIVRGGVTQTHNIDSFMDPNGQQVELHLFTFVTQDIAGCA